MTSYVREVGQSVGLGFLAATVVVTAALHNMPVAYPIGSELNELVREFTLHHDDAVTTILYWTGVFSIVTLATFYWSVREEVGR